MTLAEIKDRVNVLVCKKPNPQRIISVDATRQFKQCVAQAQKARSLAKAQTALRALETFYQ